MEEIVYLSIRLGCTAYLLYKVWEQKKRIGKICDLLYTPRKKTETEKDHRRNPESAADVMGATRFVYLDENAGKTVAPYMSQQLEMGSDLIGKDEDIPEDEVECKLPLERRTGGAGQPFSRGGSHCSGSHSCRPAQCR
jgi:hypothetical protein